MVVYNKSYNIKIIKTAFHFFHIFMLKTYVKNSEQDKISIEKLIK